MAIPKWTEERTAQLEGMVSDVETPISRAVVAEIAEALETSTRSVSSKLRKMDYDVELASAAAKAKSFTEEQEAALRVFLEDNSGDYTYAEIADAFDGDFNAKQIQGKVLSMELTEHVKPTPPKETVKAYSDAEEAKFVAMANDGAFIEEIAAALDKPMNSVRGKALSLLRAGAIEAIPKQKESKAVEKEDGLSKLDVASMTVQEIADSLEKTVRGVKTMLTRRGLSASDYDGAAKKAKAAE